MNEELLQFGTGGIESPEDNRSVYVEEIAGAPEMPEEFFSPYTVAAYLKNGTNNQGQRNSCVTESADKINETLASWIVTPDSVPDGQVIDYLFEIINGKLVLRKKISDEVPDSAAVFGYYVAKQIDGIPNANGTYISTGGRVLQGYGLPRVELHPYESADDTAARTLKPSDSAYEDAKKYKILRYTETQRSFDSYKLAIWTAHGNAIIGGYPLGGGSNLGVQPQEPPTTTPDNGHANIFFGFDRDYRYSLGSWGEGFGLTLYLKIFNHPKFGKIFIRGSKDDYVVAVKGCHQLGRDWEPWLYKGLMPYDEKFSPELEKRIVMLRVVKEKETGNVFIIFKGGRYWLTNTAQTSSIYQKGRGELWLDLDYDKIPEMEGRDLQLIPYNGNFGRINLVEAFKTLVGSI